VAGNGGGTDNELLLPGQRRPVSKKLRKAVEEAQDGLGRTIVFLPVKSHASAVVRSMAQGYRDNDGERERIWLDERLPRLAQEATAAHELGHVVQHKEGYPRIYSIRSGNGRPIFPTLARVAARASDIALDDNADQWAIRHGFDMSHALRQIDLRGTVDGLKSKPIITEPSDWETYYAGLDKLAAALSKGKMPKRDPGIGGEAGTQAMAMDYAGLSTRMERYGLFDGFDGLWAEHWPVSREMGKRLATIVKRSGVENRDKTARTLEKIVVFLKIPAPLIELR
jgi:hypothetical protein